MISCASSFRNQCFDFVVMGIGLVIEGCVFNSNVDFSLPWFLVKHFYQVSCFVAAFVEKESE